MVNLWFHDGRAGAKRNLDAVELSIFSSRLEAVCDEMGAVLLSFLLVFVRLLRGPTLPDRVVALDVISIIQAKARRFLDANDYGRRDT